MPMKLRGMLTTENLLSSHQASLKAPGRLLTNGASVSLGLNPVGAIRDPFWLLQSVVSTSSAFHSGSGSTSPR